MPDVVLKLAADYWSARRGGRRLPRRRAIVLADLSTLAPDLILAEAVDGGRDFLPVVAGRRAEGLLGASVVNVRVGAKADDRTALAAWHDGLSAALRFEAPHFADFLAADRRTRVRAVFLPLAADDADAQDARAAFILSVLAVADPPAG